MGFATGFTGGVTLTLSLAYISVLAHQRNREAQGQALRSQALALQTLIDPIRQPLPPTRSEVAAAQRDTSIEIAKSKWNDEVEKAVRWAQNTDWVEVREGLEDRIVNLWGRTFGDPAEQAQRAGEALQPLARKARASVEHTGSEIAAAAKGAFDQAREQGEWLEASAEDKALEARLKAKRDASKAWGATQNKATDARNSISSVLEQTKDTAVELASKVKGAIVTTEPKVEDMALGRAPTELNPVADALRQRFEKVPAKDTRTVEEVLNQRYLPLDKKDDTVLRGL